MCNFRYETGGGFYFRDNNCAMIFTSLPIFISFWSLYNYICVSRAWAAECQCKVKFLCHLLAFFQEKISWKVNQVWFLLNVLSQYTIWSFPTSLFYSFTHGPNHVSCMYVYPKVNIEQNWISKLFNIRFRSRNWIWKIIQYYIIMKVLFFKNEMKNCQNLTLFRIHTTSFFFKVMLARNEIKLAPIVLA